MSFAIWLDKSKANADGTQLWGEGLEGPCHYDALSFAYAGDVFVVSMDGTRKVNVDLFGVSPYQGRDFWQDRNKNEGLHNCLITDNPNYRIIYSTTLKFEPKDQVYESLPRRGDMTFTIAEPEWIGVLQYSSSGLFRRKEKWSLIAFSTDHDFRLKPGPVHSTLDKEHRLYSLIGTVLEFADSSSLIT